MTWAVKKLGDVCQTGSGGTPLKSNRQYYENGSIPWLLSGEVRQRDVRSATNFITRKGLENSAAKIFPIDTVLVAMYGATAGEVGLLKIPAATNQAVCGILPNNNFVPKFLFYLMVSKRDELVAQATGNAQPNISQIKIKGTDVPVIPLNEQTRIVSILDKAFQGIATAKANTETNLQNAHALTEAYVDSCLSDCRGTSVKALGDVCTITCNLVDPREKRFSHLLHVGGGNIESESGSLAGVRTAAEEKLISGKFLFGEGMVLYSKIRPYLRKAARPDFAGLCSADVYPLSPVDNQIDRDYLFHLLLSKKFTEYAVQGSARAGMPKVNRDHLFRFPLRLPTISEQKRTASKIDTLLTEARRLQESYRAKLAALDRLKGSLLHQAFTGAL